MEEALQDKRSIIIRAQGESRSAELIGAAIKNNPGWKWGELEPYLLSTVLPRLTDLTSVRVFGTSKVERSRGHFQ